MAQTRVEKWEHQLKAVFDKIDVELEKEYGAKYPLHPSRPAAGATSNHEADGLFNVGASFSAGYGSQYGAGYIVDVRMSTLASVPDVIRKDIQLRVIDTLQRELPLAFPGKTLHVDWDNGVYKIHGDLSLGSL
ncbi:MAG: hypothetical protein EOL87_13110 [Spartobacteria bacterium]|nr:hypothetical protein [Spartobacteria bacterium]